VPGSKLAGAQGLYTTPPAFHHLIPSLMMSGKTH